MRLERPHELPLLPWSFAA
jgi:hypothetical protein